MEKVSCASAIRLCAATIPIPVDRAATICNAMQQLEEAVFDRGYSAAVRSRSGRLISS